MKNLLLLLLLTTILFSCDKQNDPTPANQTTGIIQIGNKYKFELKDTLDLVWDGGSHTVTFDTIYKQDTIKVVFSFGSSLVYGDHDLTREHVIMNFTLNSKLHEFKEGNYFCDNSKWKQGKKVNFLLKSYIIGDLDTLYLQAWFATKWVERYNQ